MIKILISLIVIALCSLIGVLMGAEIKKKCAIYVELADFNDKLIMNLKFARKSIKEIIVDFPNLSKYINSSAHIEDGDALITDYFNSLGNSDSASQVDYLTEKSLEIKKERDVRLEKKAKYVPLYLKISVMIGVLIVVIMA
jgi:hypothetical protein